MRIEICKTTFKYAPYYLAEAKKLGQTVYVAANPHTKEECYYTDVLMYDAYYRSEKNVSSSYPGVTLFEFKKEVND